MIVSCEYCGNRFTVKRSRKHYFCCDACRNEQRAKDRQEKIEHCSLCGKEVYRPPSRRHRECFCSRACHMKYMNAQLNHHRMTNDTRRKIRESRLCRYGPHKDTYGKIYGKLAHRVIMEEHIGRPLTSTEVVHHINGDKRDNRIENLLLCENQSAHMREHCNNRHTVL